MKLDWKKTKKTMPDTKKMKKTNPDMKETKERTLDARRGDLDSSETNPEPWTSMQKDLDIEKAKGTNSRLNEKKKVSPRPSKIKTSPEAQIDPLIHQAKQKRPNAKEIKLKRQKRPKRVVKQKNKRKEDTEVSSR